MLLVFGMAVWVALDGANRLPETINVHVVGGSTLMLMDTSLPVCTSTVGGTSGGE